MLQGKLGSRQGILESVSDLFLEAKRICGDGGEVLISHLLEKFTFLSSHEYDDAVDNIARWLDGLGLVTSETVFCATSMGHEKDSAQRVLYDLSTWRSGCLVI